MINIKKNNKGMKQEAKGRRTRASSIYTAGQNEPFKISRSKFSDFLLCQRCFYLDRVEGLQQPGTPGWSLNVAVDELLKKEFDHFREIQEAHPIMKKNDWNFVPYQHEDIDKWRNSLSGGISYYDEQNNIILQGGVDDVWLDCDTNELIVVDYKAQSSKIKVTPESYLENHFHDSYKKQMDIYVHILKKMGFLVSSRTFFLVCNANKELENFSGKLQFDQFLIPYNANSTWIDDEISNLKNLIDSNIIPKRNPYCENCAFIEEGSKLISPLMSDGEFIKNYI